MKRAYSIDNSDTHKWPGLFKKLEVS